MADSIVTPQELLIKLTEGRHHRPVGPTGAAPTPTECIRSYRYGFLGQRRLR